MVTGTEGSCKVRVVGMARSCWTWSPELKVSSKVMVTEAEGSYKVTATGTEGSCKVLVTRTGVSYWSWSQELKVPHPSGPPSFFSFVLEIEPQVLASQALLVNYNPLKLPTLALINLHSPGRPLIHAFLLAF